MVAAPSPGTTGNDIIIPLAGWNIVNAELPKFYLHELTMTSAAVKELRDYQPSVTGAFYYRGGGFRTAYIGS